MPPDRPDQAWLWDMLNAARTVRRIVSGKTYDDFVNDEILRGATERYIEIVGEAASKVSQEFRKRHPDIDWRKIVITRHRFAHEYFGIDPVIVWRIATIHIENLIPQLESMGLDPLA